MRTVPLHGKNAKGRVALVDDHDYALVIPHRWLLQETLCPGRTPHGPYVLRYVTQDGQQAIVMMHKMLTGWPKTDHIDHNGLNNQRYNLRPVTDIQNQWNKRPILSAASPYKGVGFVPKSGKWAARIQVDGRPRRLGRYRTQEAAARAYDAAAREHFGEFAALNFPGPGEIGCHPEPIDPTAAQPSLFLVEAAS